VELIMKLHHLVTLAGASVALVACGDNDGTGPNTRTANVRVVNASSSTAAADVFVGNQAAAVASNVPTGTVSANCVNVPAGSQTLDFRQTGTTSTIASTPATTFAADQNYTAILTGSGTAAGTRTAVVLIDDAAVPAPAGGQNAIRFFNATGTTGSIHVTAPGAAPGTASQTGLTSNAATTGGVGGFSTYASTSTQVRMFATGAPTTGTPLVNFTLPALGGNRIATVVLTGAATGSQAIVVTPCT
jgi:hypothetical protein